MARGKIKEVELMIKDSKVYQRCTCCGEIKLQQYNFYKDNTNGKANGYKSVCIECKKNYYRENREYKKKYQLDYIRRKQEMSC